MLKPWLEAFPRTVKPLCEEIDAITAMKPSLTTLIDTGRNDTLTETQNAQPAIMATSIIILRVLQQDFNFDITSRVDVTLGHSLGEFAALVAGGYLRFQDALKLVKARAGSMGEAAAQAREEEGGEVGMVALICEPERMESMIDAIHEFTGYSDVGQKGDSHEPPPVQKVLIANINSKNQVVVSGSLARIKTLMTNLREFGAHDPRAVVLKTDCPFHSPLMKPGMETMKRMLNRPRKEDGEDVVMWPGVMPCISNVTAAPFRSRDELKDLLARQCVETVQWWDSIKLLHEEWKIKRWIGIGPGRVGRNLVGKEVGMKGASKGGGVWGIHDPNEIERIMRELEESDHAAQED